MKARLFAASVLAVAAIAVAIGSGFGCRGKLGRAIQGVKELEPKAKKRNEEIRKLTGVPDDKSK